MLSLKNISDPPEDLIQRYLPVLDRIYYQAISTSSSFSRFLRLAGPLKVLNDYRLSFSDIESLLSGCECGIQIRCPTYRSTKYFDKKQYETEYYGDGLWESVPSVFHRFVEYYDNGPFPKHIWKFIPDALQQFLEDRSRSGHLYLDPSKYHADIAQGCLSLITTFFRAGKHCYPLADLYVYALHNFSFHVSHAAPQEGLLDFLRHFDLRLLSGSLFLLKGFEEVIQWLQVSYYDLPANPPAF